MYAERLVYGGFGSLVPAAVRRAVPVLLGVGLASLVWAGTPPPFVPAEVLVKFTAGSEEAKALARSTPADLGPLAPTVRRLSEQTGVPLRAKQALSGGRLLLAVDLDELAQKVAARLRGREAVADVRVQTRAPGGVGLPATYRFDVTFRPGSAPAEVIEAQRPGSADGGFSDLVADLARLLDLPLEAQAVPPAHLIIEIDLRELTLQLSQRLRALSDLIESVDLNYIMTVR